MLKMMFFTCTPADSEMQQQKLSKGTQQHPLELSFLFFPIYSSGSSSSFFFSFAPMPILVFHSRAQSVMTERRAGRNGGTPRPSKVGGVSGVRRAHF